ncbi:MAG: DUF58 domain-containing protein [Lachnospiraceae bacterium]|nr:DUF58 domain-containing protein [Lachnospiraceae bacterium]
MILFVIIAVVALLYIGQTSYYEKHWANGLTAKLSFSKSVAKIGEKLELVEEVSNNKWLPLPHLHVKFMTSNSFDFDNKDNSTVTDHYYRNDIFTLLGYQKTERTLTFKTTKRGYFEILDSDLISGDIFFRRTFAKQEKNFTGLYVYPSLLDKANYPSALTNRDGELAAPLSYNINQYSYRGSREYIEGDPLNHINWKRTAKEQQLMTNLYTPVIEQEVTMIVNFKPFYENSKDDLLEYVIRIIATLSDYYLRNNVHLHLYTNAYEGDKISPFYMPHLNAKSQLDSLMKGLSTINLKREPKDINDVLSDIKHISQSEDQTLIFISNDRTKQLINSYLDLKRLYLSSSFIMPEYALVPIKIDIPDMVYWEVVK